MENALRHFQENIKNIRFGRITSGLIDTIKTDVYGQKLSIKQIAQTTSEKSRIMVMPYDQQLLNSINDSLQKEGFNSYVFSKTQVVISVPTPSGEDKDKAVFQLNKLAEEARIVIRNIRKKHRQSLTKDELQKEDKGLQRLTDEFIHMIDSLLKEKVDNL